MPVFGETRVNLGEQTPAAPTQRRVVSDPTPQRSTVRGILGLPENEVTQQPRRVLQRGAWRDQVAAKVAMKEELDAEMASVERIQNNPDYVNDDDWRNAAQYITKIEEYKSQVDDPEEIRQLTEYQNALWNTNKEEIDDHLRPLLGDEAYTMLASSVYEPPPSPGWREQAMGVLGEVGAAFSIPQQAAFRIADAFAAPLREGRENLWENLSEIPGEVAGALSGGDPRDIFTGTGFREALEETSGREGYIEATDILGINARGPGIDTPLGRLDVAGVGNFAADVVLDPLNAVTLGSTRAAATASRSMTRAAARQIQQVGVDTVEGRRLGRILTSVQSTIANDGVEALSDGQRLFMEKWISEEAAHSFARTMGRRGIRPSTSVTRRIRDRLAGVNGKIKQLEKELGEDWFENPEIARRTARQVRALEEGQGGVRVFGRRIAGSGQGPMRGPAAVTDQLDELTTGRFADVQETQIEAWDRAILEGRRQARANGVRPAWLDSAEALKRDYLSAMERGIITQNNPRLIEKWMSESLFGNRVEALMRALSPRRNIRTAGRIGPKGSLGNLGEGKTAGRFVAGTDEWFDEVLTRELNRLHERAKDIQRVLSPTAQQRALREAMTKTGNSIVDQETFERAVNRVFAARTTSAQKQAMQEFGSQGRRMLRNALKVRDELNDFASRVGQPMSGVPQLPDAIKALPEDHPFRVEIQRYIDEFGTSSYVPRVINNEAMERLQRAFREMPETVQERLKRQSPAVGSILDGGNTVVEATDDAFLGALTAGGHQRARSFRPDIQDLYDLNDAFKDQLRKLDQQLKDVGFDIDSMEDIYETNALSGMALRYREEAERIAMANIWDEVGVMAGRSGRGKAGYVYTGLTDAEADRAFRSAAARDRVVHSNYRRLRLSETQKVVYVDEAIYDALKDTSRIMANRQDIGQFARHANSLGRVWGAGATSLLSAGTGFHIRNAVGNWFNNFLSGVYDPRWYAEGARAQVLGGVIHRRMQKYGMTWDEAVEVLSESKFWNEGTDALARQVREALDSNTITDLTRLEDLVDAKRLSELGTAEDAWIDWIMGMSGATGWRRQLSNIVGAPVKGGRAMANVIENNARMANYLHKTQKLGWSVDDAAAEVRKVLFDYSDLTRFEDKTRSLAMRFYTFTRKNLAYQAYMLGHHPGRLAMASDIAAGLENAFGEFLYGEQAQNVPEGLPAYAQNGQFYGGGYLNLETPLEQAAGTVGLMAQPAMLFPEGVEAWIKDLNSYFAGPIPALMSEAQSQMVNRDLYGGYNIEDNTLFENSERWASAFFPGYSRTERFAERLGVPEISWLNDFSFGSRRDYGEFQGEIKGDTGEQIASNMLGITRIDWNDEKAYEANRRALYATLDSIRDALSDAGVQLPSWTETSEKWGNPREVVAALAAAGSDGLTESQKIEFFGGTEAYEAVTGLSVLRTAGSAETAEEAEAAIAMAAANFIDIFVAEYGREPNDLEKKAYLEAVQGFSMEELEGAGYEAPQRRNVFEETGYSPNTVQSPEWVTARLQDMEAALGLPPGDWTSSNRLLTTVERYLNDAEEAGIPLDEAVGIMIEEELSFTDRWNAGHIIPGSGLDLTRDPYTSLETSEEQFEMAEDAMRETAVLDAYITMRRGYGLTADEKMRFAFASQLNVGDQRRITGGVENSSGYVRGGTRFSESLPRRPDTATREERYANAFANRDAVLGGALYGVLPEYTPDEPEGYVPGSSASSILGLTD